MDANSQPQPELIDLSQMEGAFSFEEGFHRPDWKLIRNAIRQKISGSIDEDIAWSEAARQWIQTIRTDLGGDYGLGESRNFILLTELNQDGTGQVLDFAERTFERICRRLGDAAWKPNTGKHVILLFSEEDDYYQYVSYFHRDGLHPASGGCLIFKDYVHIAAPYEPFRLSAMLAHELTHNAVVHLELPLWVNEGLARTFERAVARTSLMMDRELKERHLAFWNEENIQEFWAGASWHIPDEEGHALCYSLAEVILSLLLENRENWGDFIKQADWRDAGQTAAIDCLNVDLGDVVSTFLGEGNWRPRRKAMVDLWEKPRSEGAEG